MYKIFDICTKGCYYHVMNTININGTERVDILEKVSSFLKLKQQTLKSLTARDGIKELCVIKLCNVIGLSGNYNYQSEFFNFFSHQNWFDYQSLWKWKQKPIDEIVCQ